MLVLTRKAGQQIVLPEQGITIDVVDVSRTRVRLGIAAPSEVPIHRREIWDRRLGAEQVPATGGYDTPEPAARPAEEHSARVNDSCADLDRLLTQRILQRTGGRISQLSVETFNGQIVVRGRARSHHARHLAQAAAEELVKLCGSPGCTMDFDVDVGPVYWRSIGHAPGLTKFPG